MNLQLTLADAAATQRAGAVLGRLVQAGDILGLDGPLGAGKTCFVQGLARGLGVPREARIASPTFTLIHEHIGRLPLYHVDLYRIEHSHELAELGLWDLAGSAGVMAIEWFSRFPRAVPGDVLQLDFALAGTGRTLVVQALGQRAQERLAQFLAHTEK